MLELKTGKYISKEEIHLIISEFLYEVIEENNSYIWYRTEVPFEIEKINNCPLVI